MSSIASLRSLPPKQALALLLAEKARRNKVEAARLAAIATAHRGEEQLSAPEPIGATSLVLDQSRVYSDLYYKHAPYKVLWGGRGSAKTWAAAEALVRKAAAMPLLIGCAREHLTNIKDSSHRILKNTIERLGLQSWFSITAETIKSKAGAEFIFKGLANADGLRSLEGCDILWVDEAQNVSEYSWRSVIPTIRKAGAEIWVTFNLINEEDATYRRFVIRPPTGAIVHKVNFDSNPYFGGKLKQDMEDDKARDFHLYEHIWLGMPLKISDAIIFNRKYTVAAFPEDLWQQPGYGVVPLKFGIDWGFSQDPLACVRNFVLEEDHWFRRDGKRRLFISHVLYKVGVELNVMRDFLGQMPGIEEWPVKADSAQPAMISDMRSKGLAVSAAEKWDGSVRDGIHHLRGFDEIIIQDATTQDNPDLRYGLEQMAQEARLYRYKTDPKQLDANGQPQVLPIIIDKFNHGWDATRYSRDGYITRGGDIGIWAKLGRQ